MKANSVWPESSDDWHSLAQRDWVTLTDEEKLRRLRATFVIAMVGEMRRCAATAPVAATILTCCAIEFLGSAMAGRHGSSSTLIAFVDRYLVGVNERYSGRRVNRLRNGLVHQYSVQGYGFTYGIGLANVHLSADDVLVADVFVNDVETAGLAFFDDAQADVTLRARVVGMYGRGTSPLGFRMVTEQDVSREG